MRLPPISLPRGVWIILGVLAAAFLASLIAAPAVLMALALVPSAAWNGEVWRLATYALLPTSLLDLLMSGVMIAWIGWRVGRVWSTAEFLSYCAICVVGGGIAFCLIRPSAEYGIVTPAVIFAGLLVAWARLFGHERVLLTPTYETSRYAIAVVLFVALLLMLVLGCGKILAIPFLASAIAGWVYLSLRWRVNRSQPSKPFENDRVSRLEL